MVRACVLGYLDKIGIASGLASLVKSLMLDAMDRTSGYAGVLGSCGYRHAHHLDRINRFVAFISGRIFKRRRDQSLVPGQSLAWAIVSTEKIYESEPDRSDSGFLPLWR